MTEAEALDMAAEAAGWEDWEGARDGSWALKGICAHAKTLMENAALKAENEALKALRDDDGELLTIAWMDGAHRSNKAHRERINALIAAGDRLAGFAGHNYDCQIMTHGVWSDPIPCTCGYTEAWKPPVDRKFECATEARREANESRKAWSEHDVAVRAIELWEEGFGK